MPRRKPSLPPRKQQQAKRPATLKRTNPPPVGGGVDVGVASAPSSSLLIETVPVSSLVPHPRNTRQGDVGAISESIKANGIYRPLVAQRSTRHVLSGNHTMKALLALGHSEAQVVFLDVDDARALRILLVDNRTNDLAAYDEWALLELLKEVNATPEALAGTGFDGDAIDDLVMKLTAPPLDALAEEHPDDASLLWPEIRLRVPHGTKERFDTLMSGQPGENEAEKFANLLALIDQ